MTWTKTDTHPNYGSKNSPNHGNSKSWEISPKLLLVEILIRDDFDRLANTLYLQTL